MPGTEEVPTTLTSIVPMVTDGLSCLCGSERGFKVNMVLNVYRNVKAY